MGAVTLNMELVVVVVVDLTVMVDLAVTKMEKEMPAVEAAVADSMETFLVELEMEEMGYLMEPEVLEAQED